MISAAHSHLCAVHLAHVLSSWVRIKGREAGVGGMGKPSLPSPNFCVQKTNDWKSAACTVFWGPTLSIRQSETKERWDDEVTSGAGQVYPSSPGSRGVHLPAGNPP